MLDFADAAYSYLIEQRDTCDWMHTMRMIQGSEGVVHKPT